MSDTETNLVRTLRGEETGCVPFWEVWFLQDGRLSHQVMDGAVDTIEEEIALARRFGWEYLRVAGVGSGLPCSHGGTSDGMQRYVPGGLQRLAQLEGIPPLNVDEVGSSLECKVKAAHEANLAVIYYLPWCFHATNTAMGLENLAYKTVDDINFLHTVFEFVESRNRQAIEEVLIPLVVDVVLFDGDCAYKNGLMVSPRVFRDLVFDSTARTVAPLKEAEILYTFHTDGKLDDVLPVLIDLGFSGVHGVEAQANDLADIKARFGREITLIGNMDITFLGFATPDEVRAEAKRMLDVGSPGGRYVASCNNYSK